MIFLKKTIDGLNNDFVKYIILGIITGFLAQKSAEIAIFFAFSFIILLFLAENPLKALVVLIILTPLSGTEYLKQSIMDTPGAKPLHLFAVFSIGLAIIHYKNSRKMSQFGSYFIITLLVVFAVSIIRSVNHLEFINLFEVEKFSTAKYLQSEFIKPLLYFTPFFIIQKYATNLLKIKYILNGLIAAILVLSFFVLFFYFFKVPDRGNILIISEYYVEVMLLHRNNLATFYILTFPLMLANYFFKKNISSIIFLSIPLIAVSFLFSRGAYLTVLLSFILYLYVSKRTKYLPILIFIALVVSTILASSIIERATLGWQSGDIGEISAGRVDDIWLPVIKEYLEKPLNLIFGDGRYAITATKASSMGEILPVGHPHNMYIEIIIDAGIVGFIAIISLYLFLLRDLFKSLPLIQNRYLREYQVAIIVSIIAFLISGMTDRSFFPNLENCFLWSILSLGINMVGLVKELDFSAA
jgi:O-antigen ligase